MPWILLTAALALAGDLQSDLVAAHESPQWLDARASLVEGDLDDATLEVAVTDADWRTSLTASAVLTWRAAPEAALAAWTAPTVLTRAGTPLIEPQSGVDAPAVLAERLVHAGESADVRRAIADQLRHTDGPWPKWLAGVLATDADPTVRAICAELLRYADGPEVAVALRGGLSDPDASVRAAAARGAGWSKVGPELVDALSVATADSDHAVAGFAARSLGWLGATQAFDAVAMVIEGPDARARLDALRALERLDPTRAAVHPAVLSAVSDADPRVARAAGQITE
jgi:hypothetical protein